MSNWKRCRGLAASAAVVLAGAGLAVAFGAAPAQAGVVSAAVSAPAGTVFESATATCPAGEYLTGGGGRIVGGGPDITMTDVIPNLATNSVTVWGHANSAALPAFDVVAQAICLPGAPPANYQLVANPTGVNNVVNKAITVVCPAGTQLMGTGYQIDQGFGLAFPRWSLPNFGLTQNTVIADASPALAGANWGLTAYAICGTPPAAAPVLQGQAYLGGPDPANNKDVSAGPCAAPALTTGVGGATALGPVVAGSVFLNRLTTNVTQDTARADAVEGIGLGAGVNWTMFAYNICWTP